MKLQKVIRCKNVLNFILGVEIYELDQSDFSEIEIKAILLSIVDSIVSFLFTARLLDIHIIQENNLLYYSKTPSVQESKRFTF